MQTTERERLCYLLGKLDGLRYPSYRLTDGCLAYPKSYIEEILEQMGHWLQPHAEPEGNE